MKLKPQKIKEVPKIRKFSYDYYDYSVKTPQEYYNALRDDFDKVYYKLQESKKFVGSNQKLEFRLDWLRSQIEVMKIELQDDFIYTPEKRIEVKSITDIIYYETIYGKKIYEKEFCNEGHV